jgi:hypothetical protein
VLFGKAGLARFGAAASAPGPASAVLPETGLVVLRRAGVRVLCDVGPLGYLSLAAHGHADALQVTVTRGAVELVGDPGAGTYRDSDRRRAFRGTAFHATVEVDGADQAEQAGPFLWSRHYSATLRACDLERGFAVAEHTGYRRLPDPVLHTRAVLLLDDGSVVVLDRLEGGGSHRYVQRWPFHPAVEASLAGRTAVRATVGGRPQLTLWFGASCPGELGLERGREDPPAGWWSRALETFEPSWTAAHAVECAGAVSLAALLLVDGEQRADDPALRLRTEGTTTIVSFRHGQASHAIRLDPAATPPVVMSSSDAT